jgi:hypothetical protein
VTDRSLRADQLAHARRTNPQPDDARLAEIRDQIRLACSKDAGFSCSLVDLEPHDYQVAADTIIGEVVQPLMARVDQLTTALVRAGIVRADDTPAEMLEHIAATGEQVNAITWGTDCLSCARVLDGSIQETERAEKAEAAITRVRAYCALAADSCRVAARETAQDVLRLLDGDGPTPGAPRADDADWNGPEDAAYDGAERVPCSMTVLRQFGGSPMFPHRPHPWAPQPGMTPAWCPGTPTPTEES